MRPRRIEWHRCCARATSPCRVVRFFAKRVANWKIDFCPSIFCAVQSLLLPFFGFLRRIWDGWKARKGFFRVRSKFGQNFAKSNFCVSDSFRTSRRRLSLHRRALWFGIWRQFFQGQFVLGTISPRTICPSPIPFAFSLCLLLSPLPFAFSLCLLPSPFCLLPSPFCLLPSPFAFCLLPFAFCLLPFAFCLLPLPFAFSLCLLPSPFAFCLLPFAFCLLPLPFAFSLCLLPSPFCLLPSPFCLLPSPFCLLPSPFCLLPSPFCLLPSPFAFCLLPFAFCLFPFAFCLLPLPFAFSLCLLPSPLPFAFSFAFCLLPFCKQGVPGGCQVSAVQLFMSCVALLMCIGAMLGQSQYW